MADSLVITDPRPGVRQLTISRPERRNALDKATYVALGAALTAASADDSLQADSLAFFDADGDERNDLVNDAG